MATEHPSQIPEKPSQDTYANGFDVVRMIATEFGLSPSNVRQQVTHMGAAIEIDEQPYTGDRLFIPVEQAQGKWVNVIGPERQWRMKFPTVSE